MRVILDFGKVATAYEQLCEEKAAAFPRSMKLKSRVLKPALPSDSLKLTRLEQSGRAYDPTKHLGRISGEAGAANVMRQPAFSEIEQLVTQARRIQARGEKVPAHILQQLQQKATVLGKPNMMFPSSWK